MALSEEDINSSLGEPDQATKGFTFQQTMLRVKDPKVSLDFYTRIMGMRGWWVDLTPSGGFVHFRLLRKFHFPEMKFSLYFLGFEEADSIPNDGDERTKWLCAQKATLELTHNWGTESDPEVKYHNGNSEPKGFGHIGFSVPDVDKTCERFEKLGVTFVKKPNDGKMKGIAFVQDPDGYWIEILNGETLVKVTKEFAT